jgi:hypothetical protein
MEGRSRNANMQLCTHFAETCFQRLSAARRVSNLPRPPDTRQENAAQASVFVFLIGAAMRSLSDLH